MLHWAPPGSKHYWAVSILSRHQAPQLGTTRWQQVLVGTMHHQAACISRHHWSPPGKQATSPSRGSRQQWTPQGSSGHHWAAMPNDTVQQTPPGTTGQHYWAPLGRHPNQAHLGTTHHQEACTTGHYQAVGTSGIPILPLWSSFK